MPLKIIESPGDTEQRGILSTGNSNFDTVHGRDGSSGVNLLALSAGNKATMTQKSGANYLIVRGVLAYDYRTANLPQGIRVVRAQLVIGGTSILAANTNGDKLRIGAITNPTNAGEVSIATTDYDLARYDANSYTSAQTVPNSSINVVLNLDNRALLNHLQKAINRKGVLHLGIRNQLDFLDDASGVTGANRVWFSPPSAQGGSFGATTLSELRVFYRVINNQRSSGGRGAGGVASAGFGGTNLFCGTNSGFSN
jgi:hypothetical protein